MLAAERLDAREVLLDLRDRPVELDDQDRAAAARIVRRPTAASAASIVIASIISIAAGRIPAAIIAGDRAARVVRVREPGEQRAHGVRPARRMRSVSLSRSRASLRSRRTHRAGPAPRPRRRARELAVRKHDLGGEDVVDREAVLEAVRAARVLGDVAADRANLLRRRIRRVVEAGVGDGARDVEVRRRPARRRSGRADVDLEMRVHPRQRDDDSVRDRQRTAGEAGAGAARDERDHRLVAEPDDRLHLGRRGGQRNERGHDAPPGQPVALVGAQLFALPDDLGRRREAVEELRRKRHRRNLHRRIEA